MKELKKKVLNVVGKLAEAESKGDLRWPPTCIGYLNQPRRPKKKD